MVCAVINGLLLIGAGLVTGAAFPPIGYWFLAPIGLAILVLKVHGQTLGRGLWYGLLFGVGFFTPMLYFTEVAMGNPLGWIALVLFEALYLAVLGGAWALVSRSRRIGQSVLLRAFSFAILWSGVEALRSSFPLGGFPFGRLAFAMADSPMLPFASWGGSIGLSLLVALIAALIAESFTALHQVHFIAGLSGVIAAGMLISLPIAIPLPTQAEDGTLRVAAVQGNVAEDFEDAFNRAMEVTTNHTQATNQLANDIGKGEVDLVVWPENSADLDPRTHPQVASAIDDAAENIGAQILVGAILYRNGVRYNDMLLWSAGNGVEDYYRKHKPVPFGEYIPARAWLRKLTTQVDRIGTDLQAGNGPYTISVQAARQDRSVPLAVGICFEEAYDSVLRAGVVQGGEAILIPTNNASFLHTSEAQQQLEQGRVQAVIHGRAIVQASTVGITAFITPDGVVTQSARPYTQTSLVEDIPLRTSVTVADQLGYWPTICIEFFALLLVLIGMVEAAQQWRNRRQHERRRKLKKKAVR